MLIQRQPTLLWLCQVSLSRQLTESSRQLTESLCFASGMNRWNKFRLGTLSHWQEATFFWAFRGSRPPLVLHCPKQGGKVGLYLVEKLQWCFQWVQSSQSTYGGLIDPQRCKIHGRPNLSCKMVKCGWSFVCVNRSAMSYCLWPMDCSPPGSSVHGILQARILESVAIPPSRGSSRPRDRIQVSCIAGKFSQDSLRYQGSPDPS